MTWEQVERVAGGEEEAGSKREGFCCVIQGSREGGKGEALGVAV